MNYYSDFAGNIEVYPVGISLDSIEQAALGLTTVTLNVSADAYNRGNAARKFALGVSIQNVETGTVTDLPWRRFDSVAVDGKMEYRRPSQSVPNLEPGTYDGVCKVWANFSGGTLVPGTTDYYTGGTLSDPLDIEVRTDAFVVEVTVAAEIVTFTVSRIA